jgi:16S rRNA (cytidine1402-2'-O)-methyltransferase
VLSLVATPIGHLSDLSFRAVETLKAADCIAAEDTRHSAGLLRHYDIHKPLLSYHQHNEARRTAELIRDLEAGRHVALITDAGMPGISDPGHRLLRECIARGLPYTVIPGPSAVLTALIGSGFCAERFFFGGFLPVKSGQRDREWSEAAQRRETSIYFESPYRLVKSLECAQRWLPERQMCVAREMTKQFEEYRRGLPEALLAHYQARPPKGEIVLVIDSLEVRKGEPQGGACKPSDPSEEG